MSLRIAVLLVLVCFGACSLPEGIVPPPEQDMKWIGNEGCSRLSSRQVGDLSYIDIKESVSLGGWRLSRHWVLRYDALVLLYHAPYSQYPTTPLPYHIHTNNDLI